MQITAEATKKTFDVGTVVMVTKRGQHNDPNGMGEQSPWTNVWMPEMDSYIGKTMVVAERPEGMFASEGIFFEDCPFSFPSNVLAIISA